MYHMLIRDLFCRGKHKGIRFFGSLTYQLVQRRSYKWSLLRAPKGHLKINFLSGALTIYMKLKHPFVSKSNSILLCRSVM